jgi:ribose 5-phosphate isomerase B
MKIMMGCDNCGWQLKNELLPELKAAGHEVVDIGVVNEQDQRPYYELAIEVARAVQKGEVDRGILLCWSGMGMAIVANKFAGVYAAVCETPWAAKQSRIINNSNILGLGQAVTTVVMAKEILREFLHTTFAQDCSVDDKMWLKNVDSIIHEIGEIVNN